MIHKKEESRVFCATGNGGGVKPDCSPEGSVDKSWEKAGDRDTVSWTATSIQNKNKSPIKDGKNVESFLISNAGEVRDAMKGFGITLDEAVNLGGGAIRGSHITVDGFYGDIEVTTIFPINPDDESEGYVASSVTIVRDDETDNIHYAGVGEPSIHYGTMFPYKEIRADRDGRILPVGDLKPDKLSKSQKARISSILLERFVESVAVADGKGFSYAEMLAVGDSAPGSDKGYRLWPQFGFDATVPQRFMRIMPDDIAVTSAGISIPPEGSVRAPRDTIIKGLRARVKDLTIQQLISTPEGKRWWDEKGGSIDLRLDLNNKSSPGYQRFLEKKAQVERLKKRNETRSLADLYDEIMSQRAFCPNGEGGGVTNDCSSEEGGGAPPASDTIRSGSTVPITSGRQWKKADDIVSYSGKDIPAKPLKDAESVAIVHGKLLDSALKDIGLTLDQATAICAATVPGAVVVAMHGTLKETEEYFDDPENADNSSSAATFFSKVDIDGIDNAVAIGTTVVKDEDDRIVLSYGMLDVVDEAKKSSPVAVARAMYRGVAESINAAEKAGVAEIVMFAAGGKGDTDRFSGYRIWPRLGFDAVIPRSRITPVWSPLTGFFNSYGSSIPDRILSPRALAEKKEGLLTIQALYETREGQDWWEKNGGPMVMTMQVGDKSEPGWQRFLAMRDKATRRSLSNDEFFEWLDFEWRHIVEQRAFCSTGEGGGVDNSCGASAGETFHSTYSNTKKYIPGEEDSKATDTLMGMASEYGEKQLGLSQESIASSWESARQEQEKTSASIDSQLRSYTSNWLPNGADKSLVDAVSRSRIGLDVGPVFRGIMLKDLALRAMLSSGSVEHSKVQSWSLDPSVAANFGGGLNPRGASNRCVVLVMDSPTVGLVNPHGDGESELILPPSTLKITKSVRARGQGSDVWFLHVSGGNTRRSLSVQVSTTEANRFIGFVDSGKSQRGFCPTGEGGGVDNSCSSQEKMGPDKDSGGGAAKSSKQSKSEGREPLAWKPGDEHPDAFDAVRQSPPMTRGPDGKMTSSVYDREKKEIAPFAGKEFASPEAVARHLLSGTAESRGRQINTSKDLAGDEIEYMVSALTQQVASAQSRGHAPLFYSQEELKAQTDQYTQIHPVLKGGMTASGMCIGALGSDGSCHQTDSITPEGEFLFRAIQALTSPMANPDINMQRADQALTHFLTEPDPNFSGLNNAPYFMDMTRSGFAKLQKIIDKVGLTKTAEIFNGPPMRRKDIEKLFSELGIEGVEGTTDYAVDEVVPVFCVFGPKVGTFFANNNGKTDHLTADVWFTRTWGRLSGELIKYTNPSLAKKHAKNLLKPSLRRHLSEEDLGGTSVDELIAGLEHMQKTGEINAVVEGWATERFKRFGKEGFAKKTLSKFGVQYTTVGNLSRSVCSNLLGVVGDPKNSSQRSNMIKVMKEVSKRTGLPVAYCQDLLWQDEQDVWSAAGARTFTEVGEASLYSTGIQKMVTDPSKRKPLPERKAPKKKKVAVSSRSGDYDLADEGAIGVGDLQQLTFADEISDIDPDAFAEAFIKVFGGEADEERRNFAALDSDVRGDAPAPKKDRITGSDKNAEGSASGKSGDIELKDSTIAALKSKAEEHNSAMDKSGKPNWTRVRVPSLKAVFRRGAGAFSVSHRPGMTRDQWAMARVNAFLTLARRGRPENAKYVGDNDLLHADHPKYSKSSNRAFCPTGDGGGVDNSCSAESSSSTPGLHVSSVKLTSDEMFEMVRNGGSAGEDVDKAMGNLKTAKRFELVGAITQSMPLDSSDAGEFASRTVESAAAKGKPVPEQLSRQIADAVEGIYGSSIQYAKDNRIPRGEAINQAALVSACFIAQVASGVKEFPEIVNSPVEVKRRQEIFDMMIADGTPPHVAADLSQGGAAFYAGKEDRIVINADNAAAYIDSILAAAASELNEDTGKWESASGGVPFYSTSQLGHSLVHENGHMIHYRAIRDSLGIPHGKKLNADESRLLEKSLTDRCKTLLDHLRQSPATGKKLKNISGYAMSNPIETVAEYYTSLALGVAKRDSDLDEVMVIMGFPADRLPPGKKGAKKK